MLFLSDCSILSAVVPCAAIQSAHRRCQPAGMQLVSSIHRLPSLVSSYSYPFNGLMHQRIKTSPNVIIPSHQTSDIRRLASPNPHHRRTRPSSNPQTLRVHTPSEMPSAVTRVRMDRRHDPECTSRTRILCSLVGTRPMLEAARCRGLLASHGVVRCASQSFS